MVPSEEVRMVPELPTETNNGLEVVGVVEDSSFSLQEKMMKLKRNREKMMSICLTWFPISGLGLPNIYQNLVLITMCVGFYLEGV